MTTTTPTPGTAAQTEPVAPAKAPVTPAPVVPPVPAESTPIEAPDATPDSDASQRRKDPAAEAAKYRRQLRDVEAERDAGTALLAATRRDAIEDILDTTRDLRRDGSDSPLLQRSADLWETLGATPDQFYDVDGRLDRGALADFIVNATEGRGYLTRTPEPLPTIDPVTTAMMLMRRGHAPVAGDASLGAAWSAALKPGDAH